MFWRQVDMMSKAEVITCLVILLLNVSQGSAAGHFRGASDESLHNVNAIRSVRAERWPSFHEIHRVEGNPMELRCPWGKQIGIVSATYGYWPEYYDVTYHVENECFKKRSCTIPNTNDFFGDPSPEAHKDLMLKYRCWSKETELLRFRTAITTEGNEIRLTCPEETRIVVTAAIYGSPTGAKARICKDNFTREVDNLCFDKSSCRFMATSHVLGTDPCFGTAKYLQVAYKCWPRESAPGRIIWIRNYQGNSMELYCTQNHFIGIHTAVYGIDGYIGKRKRGRLCKLDVSSQVETECMGKQQCRFPVTSDFFGEDPCRTRLKNLDVEYRCYPGEPWN